MASFFFNGNLLIMLVPIFFANLFLATKMIDLDSVVRMPRLLSELTGWRYADDGDPCGVFERFKTTTPLGSLASATLNPFGYTDVCIYEASYGDSSFSTGYLSRDTLSIASLSVPGFIYSCSQDNKGFFGQSAGPYNESQNFQFMSGGSVYDFLHKQKRCFQASKFTQSRN